MARSTHQLRASTRHRGKRCSMAHAIMLGAYERATGTVLHINQGRRTLAEQAAFYAAYLRGGVLAARPFPGAPHIKAGRAHHALDINDGIVDRVAAFYRSKGVPVAFNVRGEPWHMDTTDEAALLRAARKIGGVGDPVLKLGRKGPSVVRLKKLLHAKGLRNFSGEGSSNRYNPFFGAYTKQAVVRFQRAHGLKADGVVGPSTWKALRS